MRATLLIAANTFRETIRNKVLYNILLFAAVIILLSISFGEWSVFARAQVMQDFGLAAMSLSGLLLAVFVGVGMLGAELQNRTVYQMSTKPVGRGSVITGKFLGLSLTLLLNYLIMSACFAGTLALITGSLNPLLGAAVFLIWIQMVVVVAAALFFSTITNTTVAAMLTIGFFVIGRFNDLLDADAAAQVYPFLGPVLKFINIFLPNLGHFDIRSQVVYGITLPPFYVPMAAAYGLIYAGLLVYASTLIFSRKDL